MKFERIEVQNGEVMQTGHTYYLYVVGDEDAYTGPMLLWASEEKLPGRKHYAKAEVYIYSQDLRRTRRAKED